MLLKGHFLAIGGMGIYWGHLAAEIGLGVKKWGIHKEYCYLRISSNACILAIMNEQTDYPKSDKGGKEKMVTTSFRLPASALDEVKRKLGLLVAPSKIYRILVLKWLNNEIVITDEDIQKYSE